MGLQLNVPGAVDVKVGLGTASALVSLGYTVNGVDIQETEFVEDVKSDRYGGASGPSIDVQILGLGATIDMELVEFDPEIFAKLQSRLPLNTTISAAPGKIPTPGTLMWSNGGLFRTMLRGVLDAAAITANPSVDLDTLLTPRNYPFCRVAQAIGYNLGTRHARARIKFEAYQGLVSSDVVLWNRIAT